MDVPALGPVGGGGGGVMAHAFPLVSWMAGSRLDRLRERTTRWSDFFLLFLFFF